MLVLLTLTFLPLNLPFFVSVMHPGSFLYILVYQFSLIALISIQTHPLSFNLFLFVCIYIYVYIYIYIYINILAF